MIRHPPADAVPPRADAPLACTVRGCGRALAPRAGAWTCPQGHSFDIARRGYVSLLQPQDRKSRVPGDRPESVAARVALDAAGIGRALVEDVTARVGALGLDAGAVVADVGCGTGTALGAIAVALPVTAVGIDLSVTAIEQAARRFPDLTWVVANADRRIPLVDGSTAVMLSLHARRHPAECARVLGPRGLLIVAVPAADDLVELRAAVQGRDVPRDRVTPLVADHAPYFTLAARATVREHHRLDRAALGALMDATYRGARVSMAGRVEALDALEVTMASEVCVFARADSTNSARDRGARPIT